jgi:hypothetical protein
MKVIGSFNNVSEKLKKELIKPLKPGEAARFQLLNGQLDISTKRIVFGASKSISLKDRIYDPYIKDSEDKEVGGYVDIGVPEEGGIKDNRVERCKKFWVNSVVNGVPGSGAFTLHAGNVEDMEAYEFLCLSNKSFNNPYRDTKREADYELLDEVSLKAVQDEKDFKELQSKLARYSRTNPEKAKELSKLIPAQKTTT